MFNLCIKFILTMGFVVAYVYRKCLSSNYIGCRFFDRRLQHKRFKNQYDDQMAVIFLSEIMVL